MGRDDKSAAMAAPLPFVMVGDDGAFSLNPDACALLEALKGKLVVIAVAGLYRTGKSFLLNLLVRHAQGIDASKAAAQINAAVDNAKGFAVGGTVNACTKGIWIWGEPILLEDGTTCLFLDTEGLGSVDREQTHDTRIFALALLLATNFIYNSRGVIDGNAIEDLSLVVNLSKHIQTSSQQRSGDGGAGSLHEFFPTFMWVVRDFTLQLQDNGKKISSKQYLENALKPTGGYSDDALAKDQIRMLIADFFRQRDCVTLVRPVDDEQQLRKLPTVPYEELRDEFRSAFETLRKRLFDKAKPKMLYGKAINGPMLVNLVGTYVEALNSGKAPVISSAWSRVVQAQCEEALHGAVELYKRELASRVKPFTSWEQYENDAGFEGKDDASGRLSVIDHGQGDNAMFDENGNLRAVPLASKPPPTVNEDENTESEMIDVMKEHGTGVNDKTPERTRLPCREDTLLEVHRLCKRIAKKKLREVVDSDLASDEPNEYLEQFRIAVSQAFEPYKQQNAAASMAYCRHVLETLSLASSEYLTDSATNGHKSAMELFRDTQGFLQDELDNVHDEYFARAVGPSADAAYCEYISQKVVGQVIQRTENCNAAHMSELRDLEKQVNDISVKVAIAQGQASAMQELSMQQKQKCELSVREAEQRCQNEIISLRSTLDFKTNELEHVLTHNATLKRLADTAQQGQYRATEIVSSALSQVLAGYLIKQQMVHSGGPSGGSAKAKWYQRYFVLQGNQLSFYDTKEDYERSRSDNPPMDVTGAVVEDNFAIPEAFSVSFYEDKYFPLHLHAKSVEAKKEWVESLRKAAGGGSAGAAAGGYRTSSYGNRPSINVSPPAAPASASSGASSRSPSANPGYNSYQPQTQSLSYLQQQQQHQQHYQQQQQYAHPQQHYQQQQQPYQQQGYQSYQQPQPPAYGYSNSSTPSSSSSAGGHNGGRYMQM